MIITFKVEDGDIGTTTTFQISGCVPVQSNTTSTQVSQIVLMDGEPMPAPEPWYNTFVDVTSISGNNTSSVMMTSLSGSQGYVWAPVSQIIM